jgi:uncharacterized membrane protein
MTDDPDHRVPTLLVDHARRVDRLPGLDRLRGAALLLMLVHHLIDWLVVDARQVVPGWDGFVLTDGAAPAFFMVGGASAWLFRTRLVECGRPRPRAYVTIIRRYGLLVATGVGMRIALGWDAGGFGVLEALGVSVLVGVAIAEAVGTKRLPLAALTMLAIAPLVEAVARPRQGWLADEVLAGKFPLALYVAFVVAGMAGVTLLDGRDRPDIALPVGALVAAATLVAALTGHEPDRYPGGPTYLAAALGGTLLLYGALARAPSVDRPLRAPAAHSLGLFIGHYAVFALLRATGSLRELPVESGLVVVALVTIALVVLAPKVPQLPWSPRTGLRRASPLQRERDGVRPPAWHPEPARHLPGGVAGAGATSNFVA